MALAVTKFGGRSLATTRHLRSVASYLSERARKDKLVVVVSAMGSQTDELGSLARSVVKKPSGRELDMLLTAGERITMSLLAMALCEKGVRARSFTGSQVGIHTDESHNDARILFVRGDRLRRTIDAGEIPIVAGFQGVSAETKEVTTLGRGGSDTTAVALARFLGADSCEFYKAVKGFCSADPVIFPLSKKLDKISYEELVELSDYGARVLHPRAATLAMRYRVPLEIRSSLSPSKPGLVVGEMETLEERFVRAVTQIKGLVRFTIKDVPRNPEVVTQAVVRLADAGVRIFFYSHGHPQAQEFDLAFVVSAQDALCTGKILEAFRKETDARGLSVMKNISAVSLVGPGAGRDAKITERAFQALREEDVHIEAFTTSELKLTFFLRARSLGRAISRLLEEFNLMERSK
ncbi:aspartate kinase [candidate division WOR-3 bacterium]|nr:aspartate kinase [candidate division WOR-3 bacterium]